MINSLDLSVEEVVRGVEDRDGICIPAHVDREAFSIIGQLGYIPPDLAIAAVEITGDQRDMVPERYEAVTASDAHFLHAIGTKRTLFLLEDPSLEEIGRGLRREGGRHVTELS